MIKNQRKKIRRTCRAGYTDVEAQDGKYGSPSAEYRALTLNLM